MSSAQHRPCTMVAQPRPPKLRTSLPTPSTGLPGRSHCLVEFSSTLLFALRVPHRYFSIPEFLATKISKILKPLVVRSPRLRAVPIPDRLRPRWTASEASPKHRFDDGLQSLLALPQALVVGRASAAVF